MSGGLMAASSVKESLTEEEAQKVIQSAARKARNRFYGYVSLEDMIQEAWTAFCALPAVVHHMSNGDSDRLFRLIYKHCALYGHREKAAALGYRVEDLFFYNKGLLRELIPPILESWTSADSYEDVYSDRAAWLDVNSALQALSGSDFQIIWWAFKGDPDEGSGYACVADHLGITPDAARQRVDRILNRMRDSLGGESPYPSRRRRSNAAAQAETRNQWDGEG